MANMIDFESKRKLFYYFNLETRCLYVLELMQSIFGPVSINAVNFEDSLINDYWPHFDIVSDVSFTVNSPLVP